MNTAVASRFDGLSSYALGLLRIVSAYMFLQHGSAKLLKVPHLEMFDGVTLMSFMGFAGVLELVGGLLLLVGLFTRPVAFILSGQMAVAYFIGHAPQGNFFVPMLNQGELAILFSFVFLFFAAAGGGAWALDNLRKKG